MDLVGWIAAFLRIACGLILVWASQDKLGNAEKFSRVVENYHVLPFLMIPLAAVVIPWLEFFTGMGLALGLRWRGAALMFCLLMAIYTISLSWNLLHGVEMNCGCFSMDSTEKITSWTVLRDGCFLTMGIFVLAREKTFAAIEDFFKTL